MDHSDSTRTEGRPDAEQLVVGGQKSEPATGTGFIQRFAEHKIKKKKLNEHEGTLTTGRSASSAKKNTVSHPPGQGVLHADEPSSSCCAGEEELGNQGIPTRLEKQDANGTTSSAGQGDKGQLQGTPTSTQQTGSDSTSSNLDESKFDWETMMGTSAANQQGSDLGISITADQAIATPWHELNNRLGGDASDGYATGALDCDKSAWTTQIPAVDYFLGDLCKVDLDPNVESQSVDDMKDVNQKNFEQLDDKGEPILTEAYIDEQAALCKTYYDEIDIVRRQLMVMQQHAYVRSDTHSIEDVDRMKWDFILYETEADDTQDGYQGVAQPPRLRHPPNLRHFVENYLFTIDKTTSWLWTDPVDSMNKATSVPNNREFMYMCKYICDKMPDCVLFTYGTTDGTVFTADERPYVSGWCWPKGGKVGGATRTEGKPGLYSAACKSRACNTATLGDDSQFSRSSSFLERNNRFVFPMSSAVGSLHLVPSSATKNTAGNSNGSKFFDINKQLLRDRLLGLHQRRAVQHPLSSSRNEERAESTSTSSTANNKGHQVVSQAGTQMMLDDLHHDQQQFLQMDRRLSRLDHLYHSKEQQQQLSKMNHTRTTGRAQLDLELRVELEQQRRASMDMSMTLNYDSTGQTYISEYVGQRNMLELSGGAGTNLTQCAEKYPEFFNAFFQPDAPKCTEWAKFMDTDFYLGDLCVIDLRHTEGNDIAHKPTQVEMTQIPVANFDSDQMDGNPMKPEFVESMATKCMQAYELVDTIRDTLWEQVTDVSANLDHDMVNKLQKNYGFPAVDPNDAVNQVNSNLVNYDQNGNMVASPIPLIHEPHQFAWMCRAICDSIPECVGFSVSRKKHAGEQRENFAFELCRPKAVNTQGSTGWVTEGIASAFCVERSCIDHTDVTGGHIQNLPEKLQAKILPVDQQTATGIVGQGEELCIYDSVIDDGSNTNPDDATDIDNIFTEEDPHNFDWQTNPKFPNNPRDPSDPLYDPNTQECQDWQAIDRVDYLFGDLCNIKLEVVTSAGFNTGTTTTLLPTWREIMQIHPGNYDVTGMGGEDKVMDKVMITTSSQTCANALKYIEEKMRTPLLNAYPTHKETNPGSVSQETQQLKQDIINYYRGKQTDGNNGLRFSVFMEHLDT
eukprot:GSA120T00020374001.1